MSDALKVKHRAAQAIFGPVLDEFDIPGSERLNRALTVAVAAWRLEEPGITRSNVTGWHSDGNIFKRTEKPFVEVCRLFVEAASVPLRRYIPAEKLKDTNLVLEGWANINGPRSYNAMHSHDTFDLSGVYFVKIPRQSHEKSGLLQFLNPSYRGGPYSDLFNKMHQQSFGIPPVEGKMIVFPSSVPHWVLPNDEDEDRISLAFNLRVKQ